MRYSAQVGWIGSRDLDPDELAAVERGEIYGVEAAPNSPTIEVHGRYVVDLQSLHQWRAARVAKAEHA